MAKTEISAGGVVVKKIHDVWHVLLICDMNGSWTFPKGMIEKNEVKKEAARREIAEETRLTAISYVQPLSTIQYVYKRNGLIEKTVYYYLFTASGNDSLVSQKEEGIKDVQFVPFDAALGMIGYEKTNKPLLMKAKRIVTTL